MFDVAFPPARGAGLGDAIVPKVRIARIHIDGDEREVNRRPFAKHVQDLDQRPAVLAARQPDHDAVAVFDQAEFDDRLRGLLGQARFKRRTITHRASLAGQRCFPQISALRCQRSPRSDGLKASGTLGAKSVENTSDPLPYTSFFTVSGQLIAAATWRPRAPRR